jgi:L-threonylcarbamoyladenylate synthase
MSGGTPRGGPCSSRDPERAAAALLAGSLVALPTETVYGLAAVATDRDAIARVFEVKSRPVDHPLIVHVASLADAREWAGEFPESAMELARRHWPGPLTLVVPRAPWVMDEVTGGQSTVALRVPDHPLTAQVLDLLGRQLTGPAGVVAPSANVFGRVSPTSAADVTSSLGGRLRKDDLILDGGPCRVGLESTIVDATSEKLRVLRPGAVQLAAVAAPRHDPDGPGSQGVDGSGSGAASRGVDGSGSGAASRGVDGADPRVPGSHTTHYAPAADVVIVNTREVLADLVAHESEAAGTGLLALADVPTPRGWRRLATPVDDVSFAAVLYRCLREADSLRLSRVVVVPPQSGVMLPAILDRLRRAAR